MLGAMEWDARIVGGVNLDGIFQLTLLSLNAHFVTSITSVLLLELEVQRSRPPLTIVRHPSTQIQDIIKPRWLDAYETFERFSRTVRSA